jgi:hypothetical protein
MRKNWVVMGFLGAMDGVVAHNVALLYLSTKCKMNYISLL